MLINDKKAKLIKVIPEGEGCPWYFRKYEIECIDCGEHFRTGRYDSRTSPYCYKCQKVHDKEKAKERAKRKKQAEINEVLDKIIDEIEDLDRYFDNDYFSSNNEPMYKCNEVLQIIDKYRGKVNVK